MTSTSTAERTNSGTWPRIIGAILGIWMVISPFIWPHNPLQRDNALVSGVLAIAFAMVAIRFPRARWLSTALGVWVFVSAYAMHASNVATRWNYLFVSVLLIAVSLIPGGRSPGRHFPPRATA